MTQQEELTMLRDLLFHHDWWYEHSEDPLTYSTGRREEIQIEKFIRACELSDQQITNLWNMYAKHKTEARKINKFRKDKSAPFYCIYKTDNQDIV